MPLWPHQLNCQETCLRCDQASITAFLCGTYSTFLQSEELQALEDQNAQELMSLQTAADSARARAAAAESAAAASAAKVSSLTQELAAAEGALAAARAEGEAALVAAGQQYDADLLQEQARLVEVQGAVRRQEEEWSHRVATLEVSKWS